LKFKPNEKKKQTDLASLIIWKSKDRTFNILGVEYNKDEVYILNQIADFWETIIDELTKESNRTYDYIRKKRTENHWNNQNKFQKNINYCTIWTTLQKLWFKDIEEFDLDDLYNYLEEFDFDNYDYRSLYFEIILNKNNNSSEHVEILNNIWKDKLTARLKVKFSDIAGKIMWEIEDILNNYFLIWGIK